MKPMLSKCYKFQQPQRRLNECPVQEKIKGVKRYVKVTIEYEEGEYKDGEEINVVDGDEEEVISCIVQTLLLTPKKEEEM